MRMATPDDTMTSQEDPQDPLPLSPVVLHTLLALVDSSRHGYAIARTVEERTAGRVTMGPGTLYGCLSRLRKSGWIRECEAGDDEAAHAERRRTYALTDEGRAVLDAEAARLRSDVELLRQMNVIAGR